MNTTFKEDVEDLEKSIPLNKIVRDMKVFQLCQGDEFVARIRRFSQRNSAQDMGPALPTGEISR